MTDRRLAVGLLVATLAPLAVLVAVVGARSWLPVGDEAAMLVRTRAVGTGATPLVGVYSTRGFAHPGPAAFVLAAGPFRLLGSRPVALFQAAVLLNAMAVALVAHLAWRRRGLAGVAGALVVVATLMDGLQAPVLVQVWNPFLPLLAFLAFLFACWGWAEHDRRAGWWAVGLGSLVVQMHVAYLPLVTVGALSAAGLAVVTGWRPAPWRPGRRAAAGGAAAIVGVAWLPPVLDQLFGSGNLHSLARYFTGGDQQPVGWATGARLVSPRLGLDAPWTGGREPAVFGLAQPESLRWLAVLAAALVVAAAVSGRYRRAVPALPVVAVGQLAAAVLAAGRLEPPVMTYLVAWVQPIAAFCWFAVAWTVGERVVAEWARTRATAEPGRSTAGAGRWAPVWLALAVVVVLVQGGRTVGTVDDDLLPGQQHVDAIASVLTQLDGALPRDELVRVEGRGDELNQAWVGVLYRLIGDGHRVVTFDGAVGDKWGRDRRWTGQPVDRVVTVAVDEDNAVDNWVAACAADPRQRRLAVFDELSAEDRARLRTLTATRFYGGRLSAAQAADADRLADRTFAMAVYTGPDVCRPLH